jgi:hypothetical protein
MEVMIPARLPDGHQLPGPAAPPTLLA